MRKKQANTFFGGGGIWNLNVYFTEILLKCHLQNNLEHSVHCYFFAFINKHDSVSRSWILYIAWVYDDFISPYSLLRSSVKCWETDITRRTPLSRTLCFQTGCMTGLHWLGISSLAPPQWEIPWWLLVCDMAFQSQSLWVGNCYSGKASYLIWWEVMKKHQYFMYHVH